MRKSLVRSILVTTLIAGMADIGLAFLQAYLKNAVLPGRVLQYIASAAFGKDAYINTNIMMLLGLLFHFIIVLIFTVLFYALYKNVSWIARHVLVSGILYAMGIWCFMNFLLLPMTRLSRIPFSWENMLTGMLILVLAIGMPIAYRAQQYYKDTRAE